MRKIFQGNPLLIGYAIGVAGMFAGIVAGGITACSTVQSGSDPLVVRVEQFQPIAKETFSFVLGVDNADRGFWRTNAPAFHSFCETLRTPVPAPNGTPVARVIAAELNLETLKAQYKLNRSDGNSNALYQAFSAMSTLALQANSWSNIVTLPTTH